MPTKRIELPEEVVSEKQNGRLTITIGTELLNQAKRRAKGGPGGLSGMVRRALQREFYGAADGDAATLLLPLVNAQCGPWKTILDRAERIALTDDIKTKFRLHPTDIIVEADGHFMVSLDVRRTIPSGSWIVMRPSLIPNTGEVTLYKAQLRDGSEVFTVKHHREDGRGFVQLVDGMGNTIDTPDQIETLEAIGVKRAVFSA